MHATLTKKDVVKALALLKTVVPGRPVLPILASIHIQGTGTTVRLVGTNMENELAVELGTTEPADIDICMHLALLTDAIKACNTQTVRIEVDGGTVSVGGVITLPTVDANDWPTEKTKTQDAEPWTPLSRPVVTYLQRALPFNAGKDRTRPALCSVALATANGHTNVVATNGHGLCCIDVTAHVIPVVEDAVVLFSPWSIKLLGSVKADWNYRKIGDHLHLCVPGYLTATAEMSDTTYPNYNQVIPTDNTNMVKVGRLDLLSAVDALLPITNTITRRITIDYKDDMELNASNAETDLSGHKTVPATATGDSYTAAFNGAYLKLILSALQTDQILILHNTPLTAALFQPVGSANELYLLMPLRLNN